MCVRVSVVRVDIHPCKNVLCFENQLIQFYRVHVTNSKKKYVVDIFHFTRNISATLESNRIGSYRLNEKKTFIKTGLEEQKSEIRTCEYGEKQACIRSNEHAHTRRSYAHTHTPARMCRIQVNTWTWVFNDHLFEYWIGIFSLFLSENSWMNAHTWVFARHRHTRTHTHIYECMHVRTQTHIQ